MRRRNLFPVDTGMGNILSNIFLLMYPEIDLKPENICVIQNSACGRNIRLPFVKILEGENSRHTE